MKETALTQWICVALCGAIALFHFASQAEELRARRLIVQTRKSLAANSVSTLTFQNKLVHHKTSTDWKLSYYRSITADLHVLNLPRWMTDAELAEVIADVKTNPEILEVSPSLPFKPNFNPDDVRFPDQWPLHEVTGGIRAPEAWEITRGVSEVVVAVVDTGMQTHSDMYSRQLTGYDFISDPLYSGDGDGWDASPLDMGSVCNDPSSWHGTHVMGTIGAISNNTWGMTGVNWRSRLLPIRAMNVCGGESEDVLAALAWAAGIAVTGAPANATPADVINLSAGAEFPCTGAYLALVNSIIGAGSVLVASAGNSNLDIALNDAFPANCDDVITVGSVDRDANRASYSNFGIVLDVSAPGGSMAAAGDINGILSLSNSGTRLPADESYSYLQGTSMAAPHVAGVASLVLSVNSALTVAEVRGIINDTSRAYPGTSNCTVNLCGDGIVDAEAAVEAARGNIALDKPEFDFGTVEQFTGQTKTIVITNEHATDPITFDPLDLVGENADDFAIQSDTCSGNQVNASGTCSVTIAITANSTGHRNATLRISNDSAGRDSIGVYANVVDNANEVALRLKGKVLADNSCVLKEVAAATDLEKDLDLFRDFRDHLLAQSGFGRSMIRVYYDTSASIVPWLQRYPILRATLRVILRPVFHGMRKVAPKDSSKHEEENR